MSSSLSVMGLRSLLAGGIVVSVRSSRMLDSGLVMSSVSMSSELNDDII
jgi:hypothetical protein